MKKQAIILCAVLGCLIAGDFNVMAQSKKIDADTFKGLTFRNLGPAMTSGRIADIAIHPENENIWYVAVVSVGVWKTKNS